MEGRRSVTTRKSVWNHPHTTWLIDGFLFIGAGAAAMSAVYFLFFPTGNGSRGTTFLLARATWDDVHTWGGLLMILAAAVHFLVHWRWVTGTARRVWLAARAGGVSLSRGARWNILIDAIIAVAFLVAAITAVYFLFAPAGGYQGGRNPGWDPGFLASRTTWDLVHTWAGTTLIIAALAHFYIHWGWVKKVTLKLLRARPRWASRPAGREGVVVESS